MATRRDLTMLQNINRKLRTGLWHVPIQWRSLRRVPGWSYPTVPISKIRVPHQYLYPLLFQRIPMLRLEGPRLGELPFEKDSRSNERTLTQKMILRWYSLLSIEKLSINESFEKILNEFKLPLDNYSNWLIRARGEAEYRHQKLSEAKIRRDTLHEELGRPERYAERLEGLVNRALNLQSSSPHIYFSQATSKKLKKFHNKDLSKEIRLEKTNAIRESLDNSELGKRSINMVLAGGGILNNLAQPNEIPLSPLEAAAKQINQTSLIATKQMESNRKRLKPVSALPALPNGEPIPSPELFFQKEREWATTLFNPDTNLIGFRKDQTLTEFTRHLDRMITTPDAKLADYLAYVLYTQIITLNTKKLFGWHPYTEYITPKLFFQSYRLLHTGLKSSSVTIKGSGIEKDIINEISYPKVRSQHSSKLSFQQILTHTRLLNLIQNHLSVVQLKSYKEEDEEELPPPDDRQRNLGRKLPLTPFWQEMMNEKIRYKHAGEGWYNARIEETIEEESEIQESDRINGEGLRIWIEERKIKKQELERKEKEENEKAKAAAAAATKK